MATAEPLCGLGNPWSCGGQVGKFSTRKGLAELDASMLFSTPMKDSAFSMVLFS